MGCGSAGSMPSGHDSGPVLPLMNLPRIAYRKSIKPSQIIPPSRLPGLPARRHDITSWRRLLPTYQTPLSWAGLCSVLCSALLWLLRCGLVEAQSCTAGPGLASPSATPQKSSVAFHAATASCRTHARSSHRNVIKLRPQWRPPPAAFSVDCKLACLGYPIRTQGLRG